MDRARPFEIGLTLNLTRAELRFSLRVTHATLGPFIVMVAGILCQSDTHVTTHALICSYLCLARAPLATSCRIHS
jgi:hypothetical protein